MIPIRYLLTGVLIPVLLGSCTSEESISLKSPDDNQSAFCMYTQNNGTNTRTVMDGSGNVQWQTTDRISVNGTVNTETDVTWNEGTETRFGFATEPVAERGFYYAVYPAVATDGTSNTYQAGSGGKFNVKIPQEQPYKDGVSFSDRVNISVASGHTNQLSFFNVCGIVQTSLKAGKEDITGVKKVRFVSNPGKAVAGTGIVDAVTKNLTLNAGQSESVDVVFATPQTITSSTPLPVLWCLPVNSYEEGWKIQLLDESDKVLSEVVFKEAFAVKRSKITAIETVVFGLIKIAPVSNCYMLALNDSINIPVIRANESPLALSDATLDASSGKYIQLGSTDDWTAEIIWQEEPNMITLSKTMGTGSSDYFTVKARGIEGSAVIGIKKAGVTGYLWSWHIWMTNYTGKETFTWNNGDRNIVFMDRALGATSILPSDRNATGLYYQWGRKDPFPRMDSDKTSLERAVYDASGNVTQTTNILGIGTGLTNATRNPFVFYYATALPYDWFGTIDKHNDYLWGGPPLGTTVLPPTPKTVFDPCPSGWRVPVVINNISPFEKMDKPIPAFSGNGMSWGVNGYFYAGGFRYTSNGVIQNHTRYAYYWDASGTSLVFSYGYVYVRGNFNYRANGFLIRCEKE